MTENTQENGSPEGKVIELEASPVLSRKQNLYDQEPFASIVKEVAGISGKSPKKIHEAISRFAKIQAQLNLDNVDPQVNLDASTFWLATNIEHILVKSFEKLRNYPYWSEYVENCRQNRRYSRDGEPIVDSWPKKGDDILSYANWVTQRLAGDNRLMSVGIEDVFPQGMAGTIDSIAAGKNPANRKWRILKATGLKIR